MTSKEKEALPPEAIPMPLDNVTDTGDIRDVQAAWRRFFDFYYGFISGVARGEGLSETDAEEVAQIVMSELARGGAFVRYDQSLGPLQGWLARLAVWRARNLRRRADRRARVHREAAGQTVIAQNANTDLEWIVSDEWERAVTDAALDRLRAEVNPAHFKAYYASAIEKMDAEAVSRLCGVTPNNLYQIRRRVGARFRAILEETMRDLNAQVPPQRANATGKAFRRKKA